MGDSKIYIYPVAVAHSPQALEGDAICLGGSLAWASQFRLDHIVDGAPVQRIVVSKQGMHAAIDTLPDDLQTVAAEQWQNLQKRHTPQQLGDRVLRFDQPQVMGIVNLTPDSFSDGGQFADHEAAIMAACDMAEAGAAVIDIGGESTRPGAKAVWEGDEIERVKPVIERLAKGGNLISIDTRKAAVMSAALDAGARIINDVSALGYDPESLPLAARSACPVILMHTPSQGDDLHADGNYANVVYDVFDYLQSRINAAVEAGIDRANIIVDPGIGFGKSLADNLALMNALPLFHALGQPILVGVSRKRMIGALAGEVPADKRLAGSLALAQHAIERGAHILRVHDVPETVQMVRVWRGLRDAALTSF